MSKYEYINKLIFNKFLIRKRISYKNSANIVYQGVNKITQEKIILKVEKKEKDFSFLENQALRLEYLQGEGIPKVYCYGSNSADNLLVEELLGNSLEYIFNSYGKPFSLRTVCNLGIQMIKRIQYIHSKYYIHRALKPNHFLFGRGINEKKLYIIDFSYAKKFYSVQKGKHIEFSTGRDLIGVPRYCGKNAHRGYEQGRRDDIESIGYLLMHFLLGTLPWIGLKLKKEEDVFEKIAEIKYNTSFEELTKGQPEEFLLFFKHCDSLNFEDEPNYDYLIALFQITINKYCKGFNYNYDWENPFLFPSLFSNIENNDEEENNEIEEEESDEKVEEEESDEKEEEERKEKNEKKENLLEKVKPEPISRFDDIGQNINENNAHIISGEKNKSDTINSEDNDDNKKHNYIESKNFDFEDNNMNKLKEKKEEIIEFRDNINKKTQSEENDKNEKENDAGIKILELEQKLNSMEKESKTLKEKNINLENKYEELNKKYKEKIDEKNLINTELDDITNKKVNKKNYSYECTNLLSLSAHKNLGVDEISIEINLKNNGSDNWPENDTKLICDRTSRIICKDTLIDPLAPNEEKAYKITFKNLKGYKAGEYKSKLWFCINGEKLGEKIVLSIKVGEKKK